ncbi:hybrid sensor histidine kinase/response regulator transcription factor [Dyadobacter jiangsuensis]|uniref:histidine kinase n=1 Tax=Dyadobacter jiangsuensis TaxID=1591085 RepID=A0A2P8GJ14_9BACT|nr:hybrid sensor histidine kinase/response regulator transcription factor [Dyadobacter jiangsuensis]PSL33964.1 ligand-binding sensor domain-containing protein [Dyadobacter jiangsuensis]
MSLLLLFACTGRLAIAQSEPPRFTAITAMDGLSSNTVTAILKDRHGLLWFATDDGLNKFDGTGFTVYRHRKTDSTSLKSNDVSALYEDRAGRIWVGTIIGSLHLYDRRKDSFVRIKAFHSINSICEDAQGQIWVGTTQGLIVVDPHTFHIKTFAAGPGIPPQVAGKHVHRVFRDRARQMWVGTGNGLFRFLSKPNRFVPVDYRGSESYQDGADFVTAISQDSTGTMWIGTQHGLFTLSADGKPARRFGYQPGSSHSISNQMVFAIAPQSGSEVWVGTDGGLNIIDTRTGHIAPHAPDPRMPFSITNKSIRCILTDAAGITWMGTYKGGVNKYDRNLTLFGLKRCDPYDPYGLSAPFVTSFAEHPDGRIFVGTDDGGVNLYDRKTNLFRKYTIHARNKAAASGLAVLSLKMTAPDALWVGTFQDGLFRLNPQTGTYEQFLQGPAANSLGNNNIFSLTRDKKGKLWIGTNGGGVNVYDPETKQFERLFDPNISLLKRMIPLNAYIRDIVEDRHGKMWIASHGTGIAVFDPEKRISILLDRETAALPSNNVLSLLEDSRGNIWAGTGGEGLALFDQKTRRFIPFGVNEGLPSGMVNKVLEDAQGRIWVSTNEGISLLDLHKKKFTNYTAHNGLQNNTFALGAGMRTADNMLFFGGIAGFNYIDTRGLKKHQGQTPVMLRELKVGNRAITSADSGMIDADISVAQSIRLGYKQNFSIGYGALNYTNPEQTAYRYRLVGLQNEWQQASRATTASYTNLSPGEYRFEVQASSDGSDWTSPPAAVAVIVKPPFYLTIYAYIFYVLAPIVAVFLMRRRGIRRLHRKFREEQAHREIERKQELDKLKIKFLTNLSHEFRTPISLILAPVENLLAQETPHQPQISAIRRNAKRLLNLVDQLLDFKNLQEQELRADLRRADIVPFIRDACDSFSDLSQRKRVRFTFDSAIAHLLVDFDTDKMERILFNLLSNAFKFTPEGGEVALQLTCGTDDSQQNWLYIKISDTGIGISPEHYGKIFDRFFQDDADASVLNQGSGIGLSIVREFVQMHGGFITVGSNGGSGSVFTVGLPCQEWMFNPVEIAPAMPFPESATTENSPASRCPATKTPQTDFEEVPGNVLPGNDLPDNALQSDLPRILIVEDNAEFRHYLKENLESHYKVLEAADGREGWQKTLSCHPELIVSDIAMPEMDGLAMSEKIRSDKRTSHIPIILLTASSGEEQQLKGLSSGANDYLTKPFNFEILNVKINNLLLLNRLLKDVYSRQIQMTGRDEAIESGDVKLLRDILSYIDDNLNSTQLSVENLARHVGMSRGTLYTRVLEISGQSPIEFIRSIKLEKAALLLEKSDMNVSQISYTAGFATPNYFTKSFKAKFNMLPSEYKAMKRKPLSLVSH